MIIKTKICSECTLEKSIDDFYLKGPKRIHNLCKSCFNKYCVERWKERKLEAIKYLGGSCKDCKISSYPPPVYEFHHINPEEKDLDWNKMRLVSKDTLIKELNKCVLLCANCHRIRHYNMTK